MYTTSKNKYPFAFSLAKLFILFSLLLSQVSFAHFGSKGPFGGGVSTAIVYDSVLYLGTFTGGVYQSTNSKLVAWTPRPVGLKSGKITALAHTGKYLFAGTADSGVYIFNGYSIKSTSDRHWIKVNNGLSNLQITSLVALDSITLFVGTKVGGIFKTTDKGNTWVAVNNSILHHLEISGLTKAGARIIHSSVDGGVYATDDKGASWIDLNDEQTDDITVSSISYNAVTDELLVANRDGLYKTGAASSTTAPSYALAETGLPNDVTTISSITNNGTNWYIVTNKGVFTSLATAINWTKIETGSLTDPTVLVPYRNNLVLGTTANGVLKTTSSPATWTAITTNFNNLETYSIATSGPFLIATSTEKGVFVSTDLAASYRSANKGLEDSLHVTDLVFVGTQLWASTLSKGVFVSTDTGKTWSAANTGLNVVHIQKLFASSSRIYAIGGDNYVYTKQIMDASWTLFQDGLPSGVLPTSLAFSGDWVFLSTNGGGVFARTFATDWVTFNTGLPHLGISCLTVSGSKLFAGTYTSGVFVTEVSTANWTATALIDIDHASTIGLETSYIQALASDKGYVFASYKGGLVATSDNGASWIEGGTQYNLPSYTNVNKIAFTDNVSPTARGRVFVTTENNSLYSNALSEIPAVTVGLWEEYFSSKQSLKVIPNPNNGQFKIEALSSVSEVSIYDASGRWVHTSSGAATLFSYDLKEGIYLIKAKTEKGIATQKFVVE